MEERYLTGYCRCLDGSRMVEVLIEDGHVEECDCSYGDQTIRIYVNRGSDDWEIPVGRILLARNLLTVASDSLCLGHNGYCILEDE